MRALEVILEEDAFRVSKINPSYFEKIKKNQYNRTCYGIGIDFSVTLLKVCR